MLVALIFWSALCFVVKSEFNQGNMKISNTVKKNNNYINVIYLTKSLIGKILIMKGNVTMTVEMTLR